MALGGMAASGGGRRSVDSEINMVPMIDLLICCITFLMLTAVWSTWGRMEATSQLGGASCDDCVESRRAKLHVTAEGGAFTLAWREGSAVVRAISVPRTQAEGRYPELIAALKREWATRPDSAQGSPQPVAAVLHVDHTARFGEMAAIMDALNATRLDDSRRNSEGAFWVSLAN